MVAAGHCSTLQIDFVSFKKLMLSFELFHVHFYHTLRLVVFFNAGPAAN